MLSRDTNLPAVYNPADIVDQIRAGTSNNVMSSAPSATAGTCSSTDVGITDVDDYDLGNTVKNTNVMYAASSALAITSSTIDDGSVNDDDVELSDVVTNLQLAPREWPNEAMRSGHISLDPELAVSTVIGTNEQQFVRLFPNTSCSCPAESKL
jgi:hypothetical protein